MAAVPQIPTSLLPLRLSAYQQLSQSNSVTLDVKLKLEEALNNFDTAYSPRQGVRLPRIISDMDSSVTKLSNIVADIDERARLSKLPPLTSRKSHSDSNHSTPFVRSLFVAAKKGNVSTLQQATSSSGSSLSDYPESSRKLHFSSLTKLLNRKHQNILHVGCLSGQVSIIKYFSSYSSTFSDDVAIALQTADHKGKLPLHCAIISEDLETLLDLLRLYITLQDRLDLVLLCNSLSEDGTACLHLLFKHLNIFKSSAGIRVPTVAHDDDQRVLSFLIEDCRASINIRDHQLKTPLHYAVLNRHELQPQLISKFLNFKPTVDTEDGKHHTPLYYAIIHANKEVVQLLLSKGKANPNYVDKRRGALINIAVETGNLEIVKVLFKHGASPVVRDFLGWSPLHVAVYHGNGGGQSARSSRKREYLKIALWLKKHGASMNDVSSFNTSVKDLVVTTSFKQI
ncbi:hypothetical protein GEMRC1_008740 [Eukaryota sp. GEM-RC1]